MNGEAMLKVDPLEPLMMAGLYQLGCNVTWVAKLMGSSRDRVYRQLRTLIDLPPAEKTGRPPKRALSESTRKEILDLDAADISPIDIAQILSTDLPTVLKTVFAKQQKKRACLRCGSLSPNWICTKCRSLRARAGVGLDDVYS
jgi:hypothetical protein